MDLYLKLLVMCVNNNADLTDQSSLLGRQTQAEDTFAPAASLQEQLKPKTEEERQPQPKRPFWGDETVEEVKLQQDPDEVGTAILLAEEFARCHEMTTP